MPARASSTRTSSVAEKPGYVALAHEKGRRIGGIVVVAKDAPYRQLADLAGHEIAHPAPRSFAATLRRVPARSAQRMRVLRSG